MPRLENFELKIKPGAQGPNRTPRYEINGFALDFEEVEGGNGPGELLELVAAPQSFPHSLVLTGPKEGVWDIEGIEATYHVMGADPYTVRLGAVTLDEESNLNIWHQRPAVLLDV